MKVKRYFAPDMRQAMKMVREDLGPEAVILSNQKVVGGVEVLTATENEYAEAISDMDTKSSISHGKKSLGTKKGKGLSEPPIKAVENDKHRRVQDELLKTKAQLAMYQEKATEERLPINDNRYRWMVPDQESETSQPVNSGFAKKEMDDMRNEIDTLRMIIKQQLQIVDVTTGENVQRHIENEQYLLSRLSRLGFTGDKSRNCVESLLNYKDEKLAWQELLKGIESRLPIYPSEMMEVSGYYSFVGPAGAGKTTSICKLLSKYVLNNGANDIAVVSTDRYRIGGGDQLRSFTRILNVPIKLVEDKNGLDDALNYFKDKKLVFIDTAGMSRQDEYMEEQVFMLEKSRHKINHMLVLPSNVNKKVMALYVSELSVMNLSGTILTKVDEVSRLGDAMDILLDKNIPVAYLTNGQKIPDDIQTATSKLIIRKVIEAEAIEEVDFIVDDGSDGRNGSLARQPGYDLVAEV